jgi:photosystem II stability/assembly factor-like uncharacterized protein
MGPSFRRCRVASMAIGLTIAAHSYPQAASPSIAFTKTFGGSGFDSPLAVAVDAAANIYVTGSTTSTDLPVSSNAFQRKFASAFVAKLNAQGSLVWLTYLGGVTRRYPIVSSHAGPVQAGQAIAVDGAGYVYVAGYTSANDFPIRNALQPSPGHGSQDGFVVKIHPSGANLVYSAYLGGLGSNSTGAAAIAITPLGEAVVGLNAPDRLGFETRDLSSQPGAGHMVILKLNSAGGRVFATRFGGTANDVFNGLAVDGTGAIHVAGAADSVDFPTVDAMTPRCPLFAHACQAGFVGKLDPSGTRFVYATYIGSPGGLSRAGAIAANAAGGSTVFGSTAAPDFPTVGAPRPQSRGAGDTFVLTLGGTGTLLSSMVLGGAGRDGDIGMAAMPGTSIAVLGTTDSGDFPAVQPLVARHPDGPLFTTSDGARSWTPTGASLGGQVNVVTVAQAGPLAVYAGTQSDVFKSTDAGASWRSIFSALPPEDRRSVQAIAIDPRQPATVYVGDFAGLFRTDDGGDHWTKIDPASIYTQSIAVDGNGTILLGDKGVRKSRDRGLTWTDSSAGLPVLVTGQRGAIDQFAFDPNRPGVIYALYSSTIYKSTNGGERWTRLDIADPRIPGLNVSIRAIAVAPGQPGRVYAGGYFGVFRSDDDGGTWKQMLPQVLGLALGINPQRPNTVYAGVSYPGISPIMVSPDAGQTWSNGPRASRRGVPGSMCSRLIPGTANSCSRQRTCDPSRS